MVGKPRLGNSGRRVNHSDVAVALEIGGIESQDALYRIDAHKRDQPRIVHLDTLDLVISDNSLPSCVDGRNVRQQG